MSGCGGTSCVMDRSLGEYCGASGTALLDKTGCDLVTNDEVESSEVTGFFLSNSQRGSTK